MPFMNNIYLLPDLMRWDRGGAKLYSKTRPEFLIKNELWKVGTLCARIFITHWKLITIVDQEGIEPSSKQGNNKLSTCLSLLWGFRVATRPKPPALQPYLLSVSPRLRSQDVTIPDIIAPLNQDASEKELLSDVSFQQSLVGIKLMYYTSIKQRERSYFRQLNFWKPRL